jgi:hypothetical protein
MPRQRACDVDSARKLYQVQVLSNPLSEMMHGTEELQAYIQQNKSYFVQDGSAIKCATVLGQYLFNQGMLTFDEHASERAAGMAVNMEQYHQLEADINRGSIDLTIQGEELLWLAQVLAEAAEGNWDPYSSTGTATRQQARQVIMPLIIQMQNQGLMDPMILAQIEAQLKSIAPTMEDQYVILALTADQLQN